MDEKDVDRMLQKRGSLKRKLLGKYESCQGKVAIDRRRNGEGRLLDNGKVVHGTLSGEELSRGSR